MDTTSGFFRLTSLITGLVLGLALVPTLTAQTVMDDFATGAAATAWDTWQPALQAILQQETEQAERFFGDLLETEPSPFRIALLADRSITRTALGGAILLLEQDYESHQKNQDTLGPNALRVAELLELGREQINEADDGWYFCAIGRFDVAHANFRTLLDSEPDPVALLEFTDRVKKRRDMLIQLTQNKTVGQDVREILSLLDHGEELIKADPTRINTSIERLDGPPRAYENAAALLRQSGEYAIPFIVEHLRDSTKQYLTQPILRCLPQIGGPGLNPLVYAIRVDNHVVQRYLLDALGQIGYSQALPYLLQLREKPDLAPEVSQAVNRAINALEQRNISVNTATSSAEAFYQLAQAYYNDASSLAANPRLDTANVWYWRDNILQNIEVPTQIFNEIMCMRCCEEALRLDANLKKAQALWVAANFRRQAQLDEDQIDHTRPDNYPSATYFAQTAGPSVCLMALARALDDGDPAVALGVIESLHNTAGPASLVSDETGRLPLAEAISFPDRMVRIRAVLTLGNAQPIKAFQNHQNLMPVFSEALLLHGGARSALVVDPDTENANAIAGILRDEGYEVLTDAEFLLGLRKVRQTFPALDVIFLASDLPDTTLPEALAQLRDEYRFAATPVIIVNKPGDRGLVADLVRADHRLGEVLPGAESEEILQVVAEVSRSVGITPITPAVGTAIAMEATETLRLLAVSKNPLFSIAEVRPALVSALTTTDPDLRLAVAKVLVYICEAEAQEALAGIALDEDEDEDVRVDMFALLAQAAKNCGNLLGEQPINQIITIAEQDENMIIRTAASQTLGALDLPTNKGSEIIRNQYGG